MKFCIVALLFIVGSVTCLDTKPLGLTRGHHILALDCADPFIKAILRLAKLVRPPISTLLEKMANDVEGAKMCFLLDDEDCLRKDLQVYGVDAFDKLASVSTGPLRELFLTLRKMDIVALKKIAHLQSGNLIQFLFQSIPIVCGLLENKGAKVGAYTATLSKTASK